VRKHACACVCVCVCVLVLWCRANTKEIDNDNKNQVYGEAFDCKHDNVIFSLFRHAYDTHTGKEKKKNTWMH
jgi:hypothetical protein